MIKRSHLGNLVNDIHEYQISHVDTVYSQRKLWDQLGIWAWRKPSTGKEIQYVLKEEEKDLQLQF
jgi:hypothetical protein